MTRKKTNTQETKETLDKEAVELLNSILFAKAFDNVKLSLFLKFISSNNQYFDLANQIAQGYHEKNYATREERNEAVLEEMLREVSLKEFRTFEGILLLVCSRAVAFLNGGSSDLLGRFDTEYDYSGVPTAPIGENIEEALSRFRFIPKSITPPFASQIEEIKIDFLKLQSDEFSDKFIESAIATTGLYFDKVQTILLYAFCETIKTYLKYQLSTCLRCKQFYPPGKSTKVFCSPKCKTAHFNAKRDQKSEEAKEDRRFKRKNREPESEKKKKP